ncbi:hypothetical protein [Polaromonas sp. CG9_12]|nr:hypothetical protein [Polaromonas sp. CG9_12]
MAKPLLPPNQNYKRKVLFAQCCYARAAIYLIVIRTRPPDCAGRKT